MGGPAAVRPRGLQGPRPVQAVDGQAPQGQQRSGHQCRFRTEYFGGGAGVATWANKSWVDEGPVTKGWLFEEACRPRLRRPGCQGRIDPCRKRPPVPREVGPRMGRLEDART